MALRGDRPPIGLAWIVTWPLSAVLAATVFLSASELHHSFRSTEPAAPQLTSSEWNAGLPARIAAVDAALRKGPLHLVAPIEEDRGAGPLRFKHRLYEMQLTRADQGRAEAAIEAVRGADPGVVLHTVQNADDTEVRIGIDGLEVSTVRFLWRENPQARPRVSVVVGPFGDDLRLARQVIEMIDAPIVLGVDPRQPFAAQVAELGGMFDREAVLQFRAPPPPLPTPMPSDDPTVTPPPRPRQPPPPDLEAGLTVLPKAIAAAWVGDGPSIPRADRGLLADADKHALPFVGDRGDKRRRDAARADRVGRGREAAGSAVRAAPEDRRHRAPLWPRRRDRRPWRCDDRRVAGDAAAVAAVRPGGRAVVGARRRGAGHARRGSHADRSGGTALRALVGSARCGTRSVPGRASRY